MVGVAVFAMGAQGHVQRLRPLVAELAGRGADVRVYTDRAFAADVESSGGTFVDLYAGRSLAEVDSESWPPTIRYVTFAGRFGPEVVAEVAATRPALVIADSFALIGRVVARALSVPYVNVCAGHAVEPDRFTAIVEADRRVRVAPACLDAVEVLRERFGMDDASPLSYIDGRSPLLNLYCEPSAFLTPEQRRAFEPLAFFGSLPSVEEMARRRRVEAPVPFPGSGGLKVYVSFGTVVWWPSDVPGVTLRSDALAGMRALSAALAGRSDVEAVLSLGRADLPDDVVAGLEHPNVAVERYVDQWQVLGAADVFVTHHGLNSTHEAIVNEVPMVSYPFFWDQPGLAATCGRLGLAVPLTEEVRGPIERADLDAALDRCVADRESLDAALAAARRWELEVVDQREAVVDRILALA